MSTVQYLPKYKKGDNFVKIKKLELWNLCLLCCLMMGNTCVKFQLYAVVTEIQAYIQKVNQYLPKYKIIL